MLVGGTTISQPLKELSTLTQTEIAARNHAERSASSGAFAGRRGPRASGELHQETLIGQALQGAVRVDFGMFANSPISRTEQVTLVIWRFSTKVMT
jgi:hypothetical protein